MNRKKVISCLMAFVMTFSTLFSFGGNGYLKAFAKDGESTISVEQNEKVKNTTPAAIGIDEKSTNENKNPIVNEVNENKESKTTTSIEQIFVESISLNKDELDLTVNQSKKLIATILPEDVSNKNIKWTSNDKDIAQVDENGEVIGLKEGTAIITAKTEDGGKTSNCTVKVVESNTNKKDYKTLVPNSIEKASVKVVDFNNSWDWVAVGLFRVGKVDKIPTDYLLDKGKYLTNLENQDTFLSKPTELERITLGVLSANGNPKNVDGMNLIRRIYNGDLKRQGISSILYGLIALDAGQYDIPENAEWNREKLINYILKYECDNQYNEKFKNKVGGWSFAGGNADPDMTGMVLTALAPYYTGNPKKISNQISPELRKKVKDAVDRAIDCLSAIQDSNGVYSSWGNSSSESCSQVITGLCANKIDPKGSKFTKGNNNLIDALLSYQNEDGGFAHTLDDGKHSNEMATEQALYALAQYSMYEKDLGSIYDFGDKNSDQEAKIQSVAEVQLDQNELTLEEKESKIIKSKILPTNADNLKVEWKSNNENIATVNKDGEIQAVAPGEAIITVTTEDGGKTAICKVKVLGDNVEPIASLKIEKVENTNIEIGNKIQLKANVLSKDNNIINNIKIIWKTSDNKVATVDNTGNVAAIGAGNVVISAVLEGNESIKDDIKFVVSDKVKDITITQEGTKYTNDKPIENNLYIKANNCTVTGVNVVGNIYIDPGKNGNSSLENVQAKKIFILSGGKNSIHFNNVKAENLVVEAETPVRIESKGETKIDNTQVKSSALLEATSGSFGVVKVSETKNKDTQIEFKGNFDNLVVIQADANLKTVENTVIPSVKIETQNKDSRLELEGIFGNLEINKLANLSLKGETSIQSIKVNNEVNEKIEVNMDKNAKVQKIEGKANLLNITGEGKNNVNINTPVEKLFTIEDITGQKEFSKGKEAKVTVKATKISDKVQDAALIIGLFDSRGNLINYVASTQNIKLGENIELTGRIKLPNTYGYSIRAFVWDSIDGMKYLSDEIVIPVK